MAIIQVPNEKSYRLLNIGATTLVSAKADGVENVMAAAWACALDYGVVSKVTVVIDKAAYTRTLIEKSNCFALQIPVAEQARTVMQLGTETRHSNPNKISGLPLFYQNGFDVPLVQGCAAWLICELMPNATNQQEHDLFIGKVLGAWADDRVFRDNHWIFDQAPDELRTLHYVAGGQFFMIGKGLNVGE